MAAPSLQWHVEKPPANLALTSSDSECSNSNSDDSGFGEELSNDDFIRQRIEKMKNMMLMANKSRNLPQQQQPPLQQTTTTPTGVPKISLQAEFASHQQHQRMERARAVSQESANAASVRARVQEYEASLQQRPSFYTTTSMPISRQVSAALTTHTEKELDQAVSTKTGGTSGVLAEPAKAPMSGSRSDRNSRNSTHSNRSSTRSHQPSLSPRQRNPSDDSVCTEDTSDAVEQVDNEIARLQLDFDAMHHDTENKHKHQQPQENQQAKGKAEEEDEEDDDDDDMYTVTWERGLLGLLFKSDSQGRAIIRRVHRKGSASGLEYARAGDILVALNEQPVDDIPFQDIVDLLRTPTFPITLQFRPPPMTDSDHQAREEAKDKFKESDVTSMWIQPPPQAPPAHLPSSIVSFAPAATAPPPAYNEVLRAPGTDLALWDVYEVIWPSGPLGCGLKNRHGIPYVKNVTNNPRIDPNSSVALIRDGDELVSINNRSTEQIGFKSSMDMLREIPKPLTLVFRRRKTTPASHPRRISSASSASTVMLSSQYTILWKEGPLGVQIKPRQDGVVVVSKITNAALTSQIQIGDVFIRIAGVDIADVGIAAAFELLRTVQKPVVLVFERSRLSEENGIQLDNESETGGMLARHSSSNFDGNGSGSHTKMHHQRGSPRSISDLGEEEEKDDTGDTAHGALPRFSEIERGHVVTNPIAAMPPPPAYFDIFTASGKARDGDETLKTNEMVSPKSDQDYLAPPPLPPPSSLNLPPPPPFPGTGMPAPPPFPGDQDFAATVGLGALPPPPMYAEVVSADGKRITKQEYILNERRRHMGTPMNETLMSTYSELDDSGLVRKVPAGAAVLQKQETVLPPPELWIRWSDGPLGITFRRTDGQIVVSRLTGAGYSQGIDQLRPGDVLVSFNQYETKNLRLSETMALLKAVPKPVNLRFALR